MFLLGRKNLLFSTKIQCLFFTRNLQAQSFKCESLVHNRHKSSAHLIERIKTTLSRPPPTPDHLISAPNGSCMCQQPEMIEAHRFPLPSSYCKQKKPHCQHCKARAAGRHFFPKPGVALSVVAIRFFNTLRNAKLRRCQAEDGQGRERWGECSVKRNLRIR